MTYKKRRGRTGKHEELSPQKREIETQKIISESPDIHHNELIRKILSKNLMAKRTAEKTIKSLILKNAVNFYKKGNMIFYSLKPILDDFDVELETGTFVLMSIISAEIKILQNHYETWSVSEKFQTLAWTLSLIFRALNCYAILNAIKNPNSNIYADKEIILKNTVRKILNLVIKDPDSKIVYSMISETFSPFIKDQKTYTAKALRSSSKS